MDYSYWIASTGGGKRYPKLDKHIETEVCIIGGGLVGITSAYLLSKEGKRVTVLEKNQIGSHTSGNTTGKITSQHNLFYKYLINSYSKDFARKYLQANEKAIINIKGIIEKEKIDCDFEMQDNYVIAIDEKENNKLKEEMEALETIGHLAEYVTETPLPIPIKGAVKFKNQAQFHPKKYLDALAEKVIENKGEIYENTKVYDIEKRPEHYLIKTEDYMITSKIIILATHYPIINYPGFYFMKMYQSTSYVIGVDTHEDLFEGMYITSNEPTLSFRTVPFQDRRLLLVAGADHKTGVKIDLSGSYDLLESKVKEIYPNAEVLYRWNTEDCISLDKIPYIGQFSEKMPNVYVATGFKKWGMTSSNIASEIITDRIMGRDNVYAEIFTSTRLKPIKNYQELKNMAKEVTHSLIFNKFVIPEDTLKDIKNGEGKIIEMEDKKIGVYRDEEGNLFAIKPVCTHLGCELSFNNLDKTWDCPCHGSRFDHKGKSLYDPSIKDLQTINIEQ